MDAPNYFIPDRDARTRAAYPLRDFVRAPSLSVAQKYIEQLTAPGDLVVDPFGATPDVALAAHALSRRAIVVESNPLWAWLARAMVTLPGENEINATLTKLGDAMKDDAPLRAHLAQLYATMCAACGKETPVDYFVRARDGGIVKRHYTCAHCGETRDEDAVDDDRQRAQSFNARGLHYHLAFERVIPEDKLYGDRIEKMLDLYTPRNLYALVTLTQKIDSLFRAPRERNILLVLLLRLLDRGTSFYPTPDSSPQLKAHERFIEFNLWREIEIAARALSENVRPLPLADSIADVLNADAPRVFIGRGNAASIARELAPQSIALVLSAQPTRRLGFLALTYFWGAWILGRANVSPLASVLDSKKDFAWELRHYSEILDESLAAIRPAMRLDARAVFIFGESHHLAIEAVLLAGATARLDLESFLFQPRVDQVARSEFGDLRGGYRIVFRKSETPAARGANGELELPSDDARDLYRVPAAAPRTVNVARLEEALRLAALQAAREIFARRGQALAFTWVHHAAYTRIAREGLLAQAVEAKLKTPPGRFVHKAVFDGLNAGYAEDFDHYETPTQFVWLRRAPLAEPLIDRVDDAVREILSRGEISREELHDAIHRQFPGDLTPEAGLVELCVAASQVPITEYTRAIEWLMKLGERLDYTVVPNFKFQTSNSKTNRKSAIENFDVAWLEDGELAHGFIWRERAQFADLCHIQIAPACGYLIVPENIVELLQAKLSRLPLLADAFHEAGWHFVRAPFVERLLNQETLERRDLVFMTGLEPPSFEKGKQLELFEQV
jgi:hypothetical protein